MVLDPQDKLFIACLRLSQTEGDQMILAQLISQVNNWDFFAEKVISNALAPLVYSNIVASGNSAAVPERIMTHLKGAHTKILGRNIFLIDLFVKIVKSFAEKDIEVIPLKGIYLLDSVYKTPGLRQMTDIDLLVKDANAEKCINILAGMGFKKCENFKTGFIRLHQDSKHLPAMSFMGVPVEVHTNLLPVDFKYNVNIAGYWQKAHHEVIHGVNVLALLPNDLLQYLCVHLDYHLSYSMVLLNPFCDISEVLRKFRNEINWQLFEESCDQCNCSHNVFNILYVVHKYLNAPLPDNIAGKAADGQNSITEKLFILKIQGKYDEISKLKSVSNIRMLKKIKGTKNKVRYLLEDIFPGRAFMYKRYHIKYKPLVYWYYLVRIKTGVAGLFSHLFRAKIDF